MRRFSVAQTQEHNSTLRGSAVNLLTPTWKGDRGADSARLRGRYVEPCVACDRTSGGRRDTTATRVLSPRKGDERAAGTFRRDFHWHRGFRHGATAGSRDDDDVIFHDRPLSQAA